MSRVKAFEIYAVDLPFRKPFKHAAAERNTSYSIMLKCMTESGSVGFGECLPREYVTGESRDGAFELLRKSILPRLVGMEFDSLDRLTSFLEKCDGKSPNGWVSTDTPQTASWAAVDLVLLDAFGHEFNEPVRFGDHAGLDPGFRYSVVFSAERGVKAVKTLIKMRLYGFRQAKLKVEQEVAEETARLARRILGRSCDLRVDANMAWDVPQALRNMERLSRYGIHLFEQPLKAGDMSGLSRLVKDTGLGVMADESLNDAGSLERLIAERACTAVNVRISKCGGLVASYNRCRRSLESGLTVQVGCQVGETSLLSAAQLILISAVRRVTYGEGCFGLHLLRVDPAEPLMQFGYGGRPPVFPEGPGLGVRVNEKMLNRWSVKKEIIGM